MFSSHTAPYVLSALRQAPSPRARGARAISGEGKDSDELRLVVAAGACIVHRAWCARVGEVCRAQPACSQPAAPMHATPTTRAQLTSSTLVIWPSPATFFSARRSQPPSETRYASARGVGWQDAERLKWVCSQLPVHAVSLMVCARALHAHTLETLWPRLRTNVNGDGVHRLAGHATVLDLHRPDVCGRKHLKAKDMQIDLRRW